MKFERSIGTRNAVAGARRALLAAGLALGAASGSGCARLELTAIKSAQQRPSNVAVYFRVKDNHDRPIPGLTADAFRIYEDDTLVSQYESKQTIVNPEVAAVHYTLLLVDMSGSVSGSGTVDTLVQAVSAFADRVDGQKVALYAFDGSPDLYSIVPFTDQPGGAKAGAAQLASFKPKDPSTNLNGAVVKALDELDAALAKTTQPLKFGTLVVFTDGTDRANRMSETVMEQHVREMPFDVYAIGLGAEIQPDELARIGKSGTAMAADKSAVVKAFSEIGAKVDARTKSYYLLSYCSPARAGRHVVRIEAFLKNQDGSERTGSLSSEFDATGFAPGCDPGTPPSFDVTRGDLLAPAPDAKKGEAPEKKPAHAARAASAPRPAPKPAAAPAPAPAPPPKPASQDFTP